MTMVVIAATACGGTSAKGDGENGSNALSSCSGVASQQNGEDGGMIQQFAAGDPVVSVEALSLPVTDAAPTGGDVIAGRYLFHNYGDMGNTARVCIRPVGTGAAEHIGSLRFDVSDGTLEPTSIPGQSVAGAICDGSPLAIGAGGNITLAVVAKLSGAVPGTTYAFEIASSDGVTLGDPSEYVAGAFPVGGEPLAVRCQ